MDNVGLYDFDNFPDEFLISELIRRFKIKRRLNNKSLSSILGLTLEHLDLSGVLMTEKSLKLIITKCPNLKFLSLNNCDFFLNDHFLERFVKVNCLKYIMNFTIFNIFINFNIASTST